MVPHTAFLVRVAKRAKPPDAALLDDLLARYTEPGPDRPVDASDVLRYVQSPFSLYCDAFPAEASRDPPDPAVEAMTERARAHRERIWERMHPDAGPVEAPTVQEAFGEGLRLMAGGAHAVMECPMFHMPSGMTAVPDILERRRGYSAFGKYHYVVTRIESVEKPAKHHLLRAAFCNLLIGHIQEHIPDAFSIVNAAGEIRQFEFAGLSGDLSAAVAGASKILSGKKPPAVFGTGLYPWKAHNDGTARESDDVSLVDGVGAATHSRLHEAGILTVKDMLRAETQELLAVDGIGDKKAASCMASATALSTNTPVQKKPGLQLPARRPEVFLDVQGTDVIGDADPMDYLLGALVRRGGQAKYSYFVARGRDGEERMYRDFLELVRGCRGGIAYHWYAYEERHLKRLSGRYGCGLDILAECPRHNLCRTAISAYAFPVPGTGLKDISECMGRKWDGPDADPTASALLYGKYVRDQDANAGVLEDVLGRSRNKCAALVAVWDWLVDRHTDAVAP